MNDLVAILLPRTDNLTLAIRSVWDSGDAFIILDDRLPTHQLQAQIRSVKPTHLIHEHDLYRHPLPDGKGVDDGDAYVVLTSGTTGEPKGVVHTWASLEASSEATNSFIGVDPDEDGWICALPPAHVGGLSVITRSILSDIKVWIIDGFDTQSIYEKVGLGATLISAVTSAIGKFRTDIFKAVLIGGQKAPSFIQPNFITTYGMTESGSGVVYNSIALKGVDFYQNSDEELLLDAPMLARSYRFHGPIRSQDNLYHTGDLGRIGSDGSIEVFGRKSEMINSGGEKIFPAPVEESLMSLGQVNEAAVFAMDDPKWGEVVCAALVLRDDHEIPSIAQMREAVERDVAPWAYPKRLFVTPSIPKTSLGKPKRDQVRANAMEGILLELR